MGAVEGVAAHEFLEEVQCLVVHDGHVVAVPTHGARDVEHQLRHVHEQCRHEVGDVLRLFVVAGVQRVHLLAGGAVGGVEVVRAYGVALQSDAEQFSLEAVLHAVELLFHDFVERGSKDFAIFLALHRHVLRTVVHPDVHDAGVALRLTHGVGDASAALRVLNPEVADALVGVRQRQAAALRMRERGRVEVQHHVVFLGPLHPALEVLHFHLVAVDKLSAEVTVDFVQVQAVVAGQQRLHKLDVLSHLVDVAGAAGIVACGLNATTEGIVALEAHHVVCLPAVERDLLLL